jgi:hypothetical protein
MASCRKNSTESSKLDIDRCLSWLKSWGHRASNASVTWLSTKSELLQGIAVDAVLVLWVLCEPLGEVPGQPQRSIGSQNTRRWCAQSEAGLRPAPRSSRREAGREEWQLWRRWHVWPAPPDVPASRRRSQPGRSGR